MESNKTTDYLSCFLVYRGSLPSKWKGGHCLSWFHISRLNYSPFCRDPYPARIHMLSHMDCQCIGSWWWGRRPLVQTRRSRSERRMVRSRTTWSTAIWPGISPIMSPKTNPRTRQRSVDDKDRAITKVFSSTAVWCLCESVSSLLSGLQRISLSFIHSFTHSVSIFLYFLSCQLHCFLRFDCKSFAVYHVRGHFTGRDGHDPRDWAHHQGMCRLIHDLTRQDLLIHFCNEFHFWSRFSWEWILRMNLFPLCPGLLLLFDGLFGLISLLVLSFLTNFYVYS